MYWCDDAEERISVVQLNSELRQAQLELVSAHCATHHLRLRYSADDLARFGRRDLLRKSAAAASALYQFYQTVEQRLPQVENQRELFPQITAEQVAQGIRWIAGYLRQQRDTYLPRARALDSQIRTRVAPYFPAPLLETVRIVELDGDRLALPNFFAEARGLGFDSLPDIPHMDSLTFLEVIVFNENLSERALFHALVHTVQIQILGLERYAELWLRAFLKTRAHFTVPLEVHAFSLASKFLRPGEQKFSVEAQVMHWAAADLY
jgi:hypothetical protein